MIRVHPIYAFKWYSEIMKTRVTIKDIARQLNLSHATVSRALNRSDDPFISAATRERVRKTAEEMNYQPNQAARALVTGKTGIITMWLWSEGRQGSYHARVSQFMQAQLEPEPYQLIIDLMSYKSLGFGKEKLMSPWAVDGIIAHEADPVLRKLNGDSATFPIPIVSMGAYQLMYTHDLVGVDIRPGSDTAMDHLILGGRKRIAYLTDDLPHRVTDARYVAYTVKMEQAGFPTEFIPLENPLRAVVRTKMREYLESHQPPEAIFCHNDDMAIAAYRALCDLSIRCPDDVALVGCDGIEDTEYLETPITTIVQPMERMCELAWEYLSRRMKDPSTPIQQTWLPAKLEIRKSSMS